MNNLGSKLKNLLGSEYTEEEQRGVDKYLLRRALFGGIGVVLLLVFSLSIASCHMMRGCRIRSLCHGTWVLAEDHADGYDSTDRMLEFRSSESSRGEIVTVMYLDGSKKGEVQYHMGSMAVVTRRTFYPTLSEREIIYYILPQKDRMTLEYKDYSMTEGSNVISSVVGGQFDVTYSIPEITESEVTETYIRISEESGLTAEQLAALY